MPMRYRIEKGKWFSRKSRKLKSEKDDLHYNKYQAGFKKNSRTSDHLFTLRTLIDKYVKINKKRGNCLHVLSISDGILTPFGVQA